MKDCRLAVDIGGTFTDIVLEYPGGTDTGKVLTTPHAPENGVADAVQLVLEKSQVSPERIGLVMHGTTLATNAIIEKRGAATALVTTEGFRDTLAFAYGHRFDQYDLSLTRPKPLIERRLRLEVPERMAADGSVLKPLDEGAIVSIGRQLHANNIASVAISFLHSYANGAHEARTRDILLEQNPGLYVSMSHEVCPEIREYERTVTTSANAYVQPLMAGYLTQLQNTLTACGVACPLLLITSAGSLTSIETAIRFPIRLVESGPAGGAIFGQHVARQLATREAIAFDMGGTTAKIVLINDFEPRHSRSMEVDRAHRFLPGSGIPLRIPVIDMIEIGAGGGSIAKLDQLRQIAVGPESAGSDPGPACYDHGGEKPAVTDADLVLGKLDPDNFAGGRFPLNESRARAAIDATIAGPLGFNTVAAAAGITEIVDENMANAIRVNAADHGDQVENRMLIATGGAAPLHVARIAQKLSIRQIVVPAGAGVGSAHGFLQAPVAYQAVRSRVLSLQEFDAGLVNAIFDELRSEAEAILQIAAPGGEYRERRFADMRYQGQGHDLNVEIPARRYTADDSSVLEQRFHEVYRKNYNRTIPNLRGQALTWTLVLFAARDHTPDLPGHGEDKAPEEGSNTQQQAGIQRQIKIQRQVFDTGLGALVEAHVVQREGIAAGQTINGPALVIESQTTTYIPPGFHAMKHESGHLILEETQTS
jgi:N-methylhydantoinase A